MILPVENPTKSYWIEAADSPLKDHRTTDDLPQKTDVLIVGGGYTGMTVAYWLTRVHIVFPIHIKGLNSSTRRTHRRSVCWKPEASLLALLDGMVS